MPSAVLDRVIQHLRALSAEANAAPADLSAARRRVDQYAAVDPRCLEVVADVRPVEVAGRPAEWVCAEGADPDRRLLYLHGGGWTAGSLDSHRAFVSRVARASGASVLQLDYRLAPEHPFPAGLEDCLGAYQWLRGNGPAGAGVARSVAVAGDSAGGNLTLALLQLLKQRDLPQPAAAIPISPATDFTGSGESMRTRAAVDPVVPADAMPLIAQIYLQGRAEPGSPLASPLFGDYAGLPPLLLQVGDAEVLLDDSTRVAEKARAAGVDVTLEVYPEMPHVFHAFAPVLPEASRAIEAIAAFLRKHG